MWENRKYFQKYQNVINLIWMLMLLMKLCTSYWYLQNSIKKMVRLFVPDQEAWLHGAYNGTWIGHLWLHGEHGWLLRTTTSPIDWFLCLQSIVETQPSGHEPELEDWTMMGRKNMKLKPIIVHRSNVSLQHIQLYEKTWVENIYNFQKKWCIIVMS